jgi:hypothetical protein
MSLRFWVIGLLGGGMWVVGQDLKAPPRCTGPECAERVRVKERTPRRRVQRQAEARVDRFGRPKPRLRAERYRFSPPSPRHKVLERAEAFTPYAPSVRHSARAERQRLRAARPSRRITLRAEKYQPTLPSPSHKNRAERFALRPDKRPSRILARAERQKPPSTAYAHKLRAESYRPPLVSPRHQPRKPEKWVLPLPIPAHRHLAEKHHYQPSSPRHKPYPERWAYQAPQTKHRRASERFNLSFSLPRHRKTPQRELYALPKPSHRTTHQRPCEPPPISHPTEKWTAIQSCLPPLLRHSQKYQGAACEPSPIRHRQSMQVAACRPPALRHSQKHQRSACDAPAVSHPQAYQRAGCAPPSIAHRSPKSYTVPCDAQRRGVMTQTERFAYDLRYLFTNHRKHCEVQSAYSGVSIGEWVNTEAYGRVPVIGYKMGWRVYHFAHFHDKKGHRLKKPRIEKRKVWALYQIQVLVPQPAKGKSQKRRYIRGLPGIEGFGGVEGMVLEAKWLSPQETKAIQIEKLVRKRQIAWLVRAYPEEQVRLPEWLRKYAGPKPEHLWPGVDYRLLEIWQ